MIDSIQFKEIDSEELNVKIKVFKRDNHPIYFNFYSADTQYKYEIAETLSTILVRKKDQDFYRLYICSTNDKELILNLNNLDANKYVINIPSKKGIAAWQEVFDHTRFSFYARYDRYMNINIKERASRKKIFATIDDAEEINNLLSKALQTVFSKYTDYVPSKEKIICMIENQQVLVNKLDGKIWGVNIFTIEGRKCYLNLWYDMSGEGLYLLFDVYNMMKDRDIKYAYFWINSNNVKVEKIHKRLGAVPDGLSDYTFIKN